jgi:hypothetical protein
VGFGVRGWRGDGGRGGLDGEGWSLGTAGLEVEITTRRHDTHIPTTDLWFASRYGVTVHMISYFDNVNTYLSHVIH